MLGPELDALIATGPLGVAFQPIVSLEGGDVVGFEVLGRCGDVRGPLAPFVGGPAPLLEVAHAHGRLLALDRRWRELAVEQIARRDDGRTAFFLNVDPRAAQDPAFAPGVTRALIQRHQLALERFVLEVPESMHAHYASQGFRVAIDARLLVGLLGPDFVKLERAWIREPDRRRIEVLRAIAELATRTGTRVIAEAIESEAELVAVRDAGVHLGQGFWLGRPGELPMPSPARSTDRPRMSPSRSSDPGPALLELIDHMNARHDLGRALHHVTDCMQAMLGVERASLRLLDETRSRLLVAARSGPAIHDSGDFKVGEGLIGWIVARSEPLLVGVAERDPRFAARAHQAVPVVSFVGVPLVDADGCFGVLSVSSPATDRFTQSDVDRLRLIAGIVAPHLQIGRLRRLARTDALTCLLNRHALDEVLPEQAPDETVSVAMIDLDHFKEINDRFGHAVGDDVLRKTAAAISSGLRQLDCVVRLGGDEFLLILPGVTEELAISISERARARIAEIATAGGRVTASIGVAQRGAGEPRSQLLERVDVALYRSKRISP